MSEVLSRRSMYVNEPNYLGYSPKMYALGAPSVLGRELPAFAGCHLLYMGVGTPQDIDWDTPVGAVSMTDANPTKIAPYTWITFPANSVLWFGLRAVGLGGMEEQGVMNVVRLETDANGVPKLNTPNPPINLTVTPAAGGKFVLQWQYSALNQQVPVRTYKVYHNNGSGAVNYSSAIGTATRTAYVTGAYAHGTTVTFGVRSASADGALETNTTTVVATADALGPSAVGPPTIELGEEV